jgi:hypothetical protein
MVTGQEAPVPCCSVSTERTRCILEPSQAPHGSHALTTQSCGHTWLLHEVKNSVAGHSLPRPVGCVMIVLILLFSPPSHGAEHACQLVHSLATQSRVTEGAGVGTDLHSHVAHSVPKPPKGHANALQFWVECVTYLHLLTKLPSKLRSP